MKNHLPLLKKLSEYFLLAQNGIDNVLSHGLELLLEALDFYAVHIFLYNPLTGFLECRQTIVRGRGVIAGEGKVQVKDNKNNLMVQVFLGQKEYVLNNDELFICVAIREPTGKALGVLVAERLRGPILESAIYSLKDFAAEFGLGIYNVNRFLEEQQKRSKFQALCKIASFLTSTLELREVLSIVLNSCINDLKFDRAKLYLIDDKKGIIKSYMSVDIRGAVAKMEQEEYSLKDEKNWLVKIILRRENELIEENISKLVTFMPLKIKNEIFGVLVVDNIFSHQLVIDEDVDALRTLVNQATLVIENAQLFKEVQALSIKDSLTGLYNYRFLKQRLPEELQRAARFGDKVSLMFLDIDRFKFFNDTHGHQIGDRILKFFSNVALKNLRSIDLLARYGGDEFIVVLPRTKQNKVKDIALRLKDSIKSLEIPISNGRKLNFTISIGISIYPDNAKEADDLIKQADRALYLAKEQGGNRICLAKEVK